tara:strand:- start:9230 stop:9454 length:225 start_codon:yes stop_codon:yes gene_type:complete
MPIAETLFFSGVACFLFFILGGIIGWIGNDVVYATRSGGQDPEYEHPEMYDSTGRPYSGELLTLHFDQQEEEEE